MADDIDLANDLIDSEVARALSKIRQSAALTTVGSKFCLECGDTIPVGRTKLGFSFCVSCAEDAERKKSIFID